uniref:Uncharacterized protein n=1 Tax=Meloidogyne incognita TaxID=6306 RepID=A0A914L482_MELIC
MSMLWKDKNQQKKSLKNSNLLLEFSKLDKEHDYQHLMDQLNMQSNTGIFVTPAI